MSPAFMITFGVRRGCLQVSRANWLCFSPPLRLGSCRWRWRGAEPYRGTLLERFYRHSLSKDAQQTVIVLGSAKNDPKRLEAIASQRLGRLLKEDLLPILFTLLENGQTQVATVVFHHIQKEMWYRPERKFYQFIIRAFMDGESYEEVDKLLEEMELRGFSLDKKFTYQLIEAAAAAKQYMLAFKIFTAMKSRLKPSANLYPRLIEVLNRCGEFDRSLKLEEEMLEHEYKAKLLPLSAAIHQHTGWAS